MAPLVAENERQFGHVFLTRQVTRRDVVAAYGRPLWTYRVDMQRVVIFVQVKVKVKASHTRYRALGPEMIPVYRQSACR